MPQPDPVITRLQQWTEVSMHHSMRDFIRFAREKGLSMSQLGALLNLHHSESCAVSDLGEHLGVSSAAASQLLERLVQQHLIARSEDPDDRRVKQVVLTPEGRQLVREGVRARQAWLADLAAALSPIEKEQVAATLQTLIDRAHQLEQR
jgi:DNA-binding MarR family transcriptional regulator